MVMVVCPAAKGIDADAVPEATVVPFTVMAAFGSMAVGVTVIDVIELRTAVV